MKKFWSILICMLLVFTMALTGCASQAPVAPAESNTAAGDKANEANNEFKAQITFNGSSTLAPVISAIATDFIEEYTTWNKVNSSFPEKNIAIYVSAGGSEA